MPIPVLVGLAALATGAYGVKKGFDAKEDMDRAKEYNKEAQAIVDAATESIKVQKDDTAKQIEVLGRRKIEVCGTSMNDFVNNFGKIKNVDFTDSEGLDELKNFKPDSPTFKELKKISIEASDLVAGGLGSIAGSTLLAAGTYGAVMTGGFAVASTGAGIAGLSGVAATNATLAWLGGGSLAAGGFGMAGGMAVLGGLVAGPALALGGAFMASKAEDAKYKALDNRDKACEYREESKGIVSMLRAIGRRADQIDDVLSELNERFCDYVEELIDIIDVSGTDYKEYTAKEKKVVVQAASVAVAVKSILDTSLLHEDGKLDEEGTNKAIKMGKKLLRAE